ncbi:LysE family translocator [uncultured Cohaesibacter sp.]|uniref:LysE family translocator n=1 Tax=uncultured Cohaesibacter sp. TaxID=1002546 RepID=UPI002AAC23CD|nr:LysE family translocator [uncultured Cohaesibacter sp.]
MADWSTLMAFAVFVCVMSGTPGPGNLTFMALGAKAGFGAVVRPLCGAILGAAILGLCVALGLGALLMQEGWIANIFRGLSMGYMLYLAWRIMTMHKADKKDAAHLSFAEGILIHPLSPKTWAMYSIAFSLYFNPTGSLLDETAILIGGFAMGGLVFHSLWGFMGAKVMQFLGDGRKYQLFTATMAVLMVGTTAWSLWAKTGAS